MNLALYTLMLWLCTISAQILPEKNSTEKQVPSIVCAQLNFCGDRTAWLTQSKQSQTADSLARMLQKLEDLLKTRQYYPNRIYSEVKLDASNVLSFKLRSQGIPDSEWHTQYVKMELKMLAVEYAEPLFLSNEVHFTCDDREKCIEKLFIGKYDPHVTINGKRVKDPDETHRFYLDVIRMKSEQDCKDLIDTIEWLKAFTPSTPRRKLSRRRQQKG